MIQMRHVTFLSVMFLLGIVCSLFGLIYLIFPTVIIVIALYEIKGFNLYLPMLVVFFLIGYLYANEKEKDFIRINDYYNPKDVITVQGEIYKKEQKNDKYRIYIKNIVCKDLNLNRIDFRILISSSKDYACIGSTINASGNIIEISRAENEGEFDYKKYLKGQDIFLYISSDNIIEVKKPTLGILNYLYELRIKIKEFYKTYLPGEESGLLSSMVLGDKTDLDTDANELFQSAGLSHILAISGLHLSLIGVGIYRILRKLRFGFFSAGAISSLVVIFYGFLCQNPISLVRAIVMFILFVFSNIVGRSYDMITALSVSGLLLLMQNPFYVYHSGFVMSFMAVLGICVLANPVNNLYLKACKTRWESIFRTDRGKSYSPSLKEKIISSVIFGFMLQAFTYPVMALYFNRIPVYVILLNLLVLPFLGVLLISGLISGVLFFYPGLMICHFILYFYEFAADKITSLPGTVLILSTPKLWAVFVYYFVLFLFTHLSIKKCENKISLIGKNRIKVRKTLRIDGRLLRLVREKNIRGYIAYKYISDRLLVTLIKFLGVIFLLILFLVLQKPRGFRIDMLSLGQGDGIFIQSKENVTFFIDGGSSSKKDVGKYTILPYLKAVGVGSVDYWILTHLDDDHINGFMELMESGYKIDNLCLPKTSASEERFSEIKILCDLSDTKINLLETGNSLGTKSLKLSVFSPDYPSRFEGANENSLGILLEYKNFQGIFTGDMGKEQEKYLLSSDYFNSLIRNKTIEVLKVAHHGSKNSNSIEWLKALQPEVAIISAGDNNRYGHPNKETIERLDEENIKHYCTIDSGRIRIVYENGEVRVERYLTNDIL